jgi:hypothetical protein
MQKEPDMSWKKEWQNMPEFIQEKKKEFFKLTVRFDTQEDVDIFATLIQQKITPKTKSLWYPFKSHFGHRPKVEWVDDNQ